MSYQRAMEALAGRHTDRVAQFEFLTHARLFGKVSGLDPGEHPNEAHLAYLERYDIDATLIPQLGRPRLRDGEQVREGRHASTAWGMRETGWLVDPIYKTPEDILTFDPATHDASSAQQKTDGICEMVAAAQAGLGDRALFVPGHFMLVLHYMPYWCDWAVFMELLALRPDDCRPLFDRCMEYSIDIFTAYAASSAPMIVAHEDLCSTRGPIYPPDLLRREVFPRFRRIYEPLKRAGKKVLAISDGKIEAIAPDLVAAGADGLFIEPMNDTDAIIDMVGPGGIVVGGGNTRTLTLGSPDQIAAEVEAQMAMAKRLPGFFFCLGGEAPQNVPLENIEAYFDACARFGRKDPPASGPA